MNPFVIVPIILILLLIVIFIVWDSHRFVVKRYVIESEKIRRDKSFVFLSDLHDKVYGKNNESVIAAIDSLSPSVVLVGGDILTAYPGKDFSPASDFIARLSDKYEIIYAEGNHEFRTRIYPEVYGTMNADYCKAIGDKVIIRVNERIISEDVDIYCCSIGYEYYRRFKTFPMSDDYLNSVLGDADTGKFNLLLAHNPDYFDNYSKWGADLTLSGHVHGGVVRIPFWRGLISPMCRLFPKYDGGLFKKDGKKMIVSRGLGMHTIPLRLFNPAEIVYIELKHKD